MHNSGIIQDIRKWTSLLITTSILILASIIPGNSQESDSLHSSIHLASLNDTLIPIITNKIAGYGFTLDRDSFFLLRNYNLKEITKGLEDAEARVETYHNLLSRIGNNMNLRGLNTSLIMLRDINNRLDNYKSTLENYQQSLTIENTTILEILKDSVLRIPIADAHLAHQIKEIHYNAIYIDSSQKTLKTNINLLLNRLAVCHYEGQHLISDMLYLTIKKKTGIFTPERTPLFLTSKDEYRQGAWENIKRAITVNFKILKIYLKSRLNILLLTLVLFIILYSWIRFNFKLIQAASSYRDIAKRLQFLKSNKVSASILAILVLLPLLLKDPPAAILHLTEVIQFLLVIKLINNHLTPLLKRALSFFGVLFFALIMDDLLLGDSIGERWFLFIATIITLGFASIMWLKRATIFTRPYILKSGSKLFIISGCFVIIGLIANIRGNFALAKIAMITSIEIVHQALILSILFAIIVESAFLQSEANQNSRLSELVNFERIKDNLRNSLMIILGLIWIVSLLRNLTLYSWFYGSIIKFLDVERTVGKYSFTFSSIMIFILVIWIASLISGTINHFFGYERSMETGKRSKLSSMALIFRLTIWAVGFLVAVAASGIPIDKLSIMLGALGVGIGFGLQNIVNNLVSGIILAFERPVQVGDHIELNGKIGVIKEVGVRASKINNLEGADIVIPNGDLLSQSVINWTMQNRNKKVSFTFWVSYETNLEHIKTLVLNHLKGQLSILHKPVPEFNVLHFNKWGIQISITFWVPDSLKASSTRSDVMIHIKTMLEDEGVPLRPEIFPLVDGGEE